MCHRPISREHSLHFHAPGDRHLRTANEKPLRERTVALPDAYNAYVIELVRERYLDFGPTLAREKLVELHGVSVDLERLRKG